MKTKNKKLILNCINCKKNYEKGFNKELIKRFANTCKFCNGNLNKFILLLRKGVYPYYDNDTDYDMLLMLEEGIRGEICHSIHRHARANNKYMKNYDENKESSYIQYLDANNLYGWAMSQKLPVNGSKWINDVIEVNEEFIKNYDENNDKGYILEVDVKYSKKLHDLHSDLPFLPKRMKIDKCKKLVCNLRNKKNTSYI